MNKTYNAEYEDLLKVEKLTSGYKVILGIPSYMYQTQIATDIEDEEQFLKYIYSEILKRNYIRTYFYKVRRYTDPIREFRE